jgi:hypothetical protein
MIELAIATGIPMCHWAAADDATLATALDVLRELADGR